MTTVSSGLDYTMQHTIDVELTVSQLHIAMENTILSHKIPLTLCLYSSGDV